MLFNSFEFIFLFLPATLALFYVADRIGPRHVVAVLALASIIFYSYSGPRDLLLLICSIAVNYAAGDRLVRTVGHPSPPRRLLLSCAVFLNLANLFTFKYLSAIISFLNDVGRASLTPVEIALPVGISFYTFTQIAFLVDAYHGNVREHTPLRYLLFVTFFPHLIAGPILHHREMMPQFSRLRTAGTAQNMMVGITLFAIGLFKKTVIADTIALGSTPVFDAAAAGQAPMLVEAWGAALCYTFQIYFDFSGYSDMAVGLARMVGVRFPMNFASPYRALSIADFWRRWHITLSRFLRDYLYIPLGGNRGGPARTYMNLFATMTLGGIWHGASWTFLIWGMLHGAFLMINRAWSESGRRLPGGVVASWVLTMTSVVIAWVAFRAESWTALSGMYAGMLGLNGVTGLNPSGSVDSDIFLFGIPLLFAIVLALPNSYEWMRSTDPALPTRGYPATRLEASPARHMEWRPSIPTAIYVAVLLGVGIASCNEFSEFIYFKF